MGFFNDKSRDISHDNVFHVDVETNDLVPENTVLDDGMIVWNYSLDVWHF